MSYENYQTMLETINITKFLTFFISYYDSIKKLMTDKIYLPQIGKGIFPSKAFASTHINSSESC